MNFGVGGSQFSLQQNGYVENQIRHKYFFFTPNISTWTSLLQKEFKSLNSENHILMNEKKYFQKFYKQSVPNSLKFYPLHNWVYPSSKTNLGAESTMVNRTERFLLSWNSHPGVERVRKLIWKYISKQASDSNNWHEGKIILEYSALGYCRLSGSGHLRSHNVMGGKDNCEKHPTY